MNNLQDGVPTDYWREQPDVDIADDVLVVKIVDQPLRADGLQSLRVCESLRFLSSEALPSGKLRYTFTRLDIPSHRPAAPATRSQAR
jgi:hypothetical protein